MPRGKKVVEDALGEALKLYVNAVRMVVLGTVLLNGGTKNQAIEISVGTTMGNLVAKDMKNLVDHVTNEFKSLK